MRQIIPFKKEIIFKSPVSEIISISLEHTLHLEDDTISGDFIVSGQYRENIASPNVEDFYYSIPCEIAINSSYDASNLRIDIDDFFYEIVNNNVLKINIDVLVDGLISNEIVMPETFISNKNMMDKEEESELGEKIMKEEECVSEERSCDKDLWEDTTITDANIKESVKTLFDSFDDSTETFATYSIYLVRESDTLESILLKYNITKEELADYNNLEELKIGTKLIIPASIKYE